MNRAISAAGKNRVATGRDRAPGVVGRFLAGTANGQVGVDSRRLENADGVVQFHVALSSATAGIRVE